MSGKIKRKDDFNKGHDEKIRYDCGKNIDCAMCEKSNELAHKPLQISCGQGGSAQFSIPNATPATIGFVTVDARKLCKPVVKIKFSSSVSLTSTADDPQARLTFSLFRSCDGGAPMLLESWNYEVFQIENIFDIIGLTNSFTFIFCDCLNSSRLCEYFVQVSADNMVNAAVSVDNVQIQAIVHQALLSCGQGMSAVFSGNNETEPIIPTPSSAGLGQVTVSPRGLHKPVVEIEFSSIVNLIAGDDAKASLNFQLFRTCEEKEPVLVNNWIYEVFLIENALDIRLSTSFSFTFCESLNCIECCDYFVEVSVGGLDEVDTISVTDVHIAALAGESGECEKEIDCIKSIQNHSLTKSTLLSCGRGRSAAFVNPDMPSIPVGRVQIDTRDICNPTVSIEFSSIVSYLVTEDDAQGRLKFELFRVCDNGKPILLNNWAYELKRIDDVFENTRFIDSFDFNFCDESACSGCCEYFVEVSIENLFRAVILVDNVHITALAS